MTLGRLPLNFLFERSASQQRIARSLRQLLAEPSFRSSAERLGAAVRASAGPRRVVEEIHAVAISTAGRCRSC